MSDFLLDAYAARSCPVKTFNTFDPETEQPDVPLDNSLRESFEGGSDFRQSVLDRIVRHNPGTLDLRNLQGSIAEKEATCLEAMTAGIRVIVGGLLPPDHEGHRKGSPDALVRGSSAQDGGPGYWPLKIKPYRVLEQQIGPAQLQHSSINTVGVLRPLADRRYRVFRQGALLELAHYWRLLGAFGFASELALGGVIGDDRSYDPPVAAWVNLQRKFIRTFSRSSPSRYQLRSALERYDHEHSFRVYVAERARSCDEAPPVRPIRINECEWCAWWQVCRPRMDDDDLSLRISKAPLDVRELQTLTNLGVTTVAELAAADLEELLPEYLPLTTHRDHAETRLRQAAHRARMLSKGVALERVSTEPIRVPRAELEIDLDIETSESGTVYLWGALVYDQKDHHYIHFSSFEDLDQCAEIELAARFARWLLELHAEHPTLLVFHYSDYEPVNLHRLAERSKNPDLLACCELIRDHFVDLFRYIRDNYVAVDGLGLKVVASKGAGFEWRDEEPGGLASQSWFQDAISADTEDQRSEARTRVLEYNEDDVLATLAVRNWMSATDDRD